MSVCRQTERGNSERRWKDRQTSPGRESSNKWADERKGEDKTRDGMLLSAKAVSFSHSLRTLSSADGFFFVKNWNLNCNRLLYREKETVITQIFKWKHLTRFRVRRLSDCWSFDALEKKFWSLTLECCSVFPMFVCFPSPGVCQALLTSFDYRFLPHSNAPFSLSSTKSSIHSWQHLPNKLPSLLFDSRVTTACSSKWSLASTWRGKSSIILKREIAELSVSLLRFPCRMFVETCVRKGVSWQEALTILVSCHRDKRSFPS